MLVGGGLGSDCQLGEGVQTLGGHSAWRHRGWRKYGIKGSLG